MSLTRRAKRLGLVLLVAQLALPALAEPEAAESACDDARAAQAAAVVQAHYDQVADLSAGFEQRSQSVVLGGVSMGAEAPTRGRVVFAKPGKMRWAYTEPAESFVISDGHVLWIYDVAEKQASKLPMEQDYLAGAALQFLLGDGQILESFRVSAERCEDGRIDLELIPKQAASYERLGLSADEETGEIAETVIVDLFGNRTLIAFQEVRINLDPPAETFTFEPPAGVDVIDLRLTP
ncbi:MAG: outer membrane lipoprotein carrier protein LolA [Deltaproteobacteria bacterium]|nr:outer membrane lipoprotein carrier protein LolA [Deltaproteobacteria bacterium]